MDPLDDFRHGTDVAPPIEPEAERASRAPLWIAAALILLGAVIAASVWYVRSRAANAARADRGQSALPISSEVREPLGPAVEPIELPPLVLTDPLVRELLGKLSSSPTLAAWLATDGLIRAFAVSVENVADGASPARHLRVLAPRAPFKTVTEGRTITIDRGSYSRYDGVANAVASMDAAGLARVYSMLKPRLAEAYAELGHRESELDTAVERAIVLLLQTPVVEGPVALRSRVLSFKYERDDLEALTAAQKHLLRMGPRNQRIVQDEIRAIARDLGIPSSRLPPRQAIQ